MTLKTKNIYSLTHPSNLYNSFKIICDSTMAKSGASRYLTFVTNPVLSYFMQN